MTPEQQEAYLQNQLSCMRQYDLQKNVLCNNLQINKNYTHTSDFINKYNPDYEPKNNLNEIYTESQLEESLNRIDDIIDKKRNSEPIPFVETQAPISQPPALFQNQNNMN